MTLQNIVHQIIKDKDLDVPDWGSCQYEEAANLFAVLEHQGFTSLGIEVKFDRSFHIKEILPAILNELKADFGCPHCINDPDYLEFPVEFTSIEEVFDWCKAEAWDLWSAASFIADFCFKGLNFTNMETPIGFGPLLNKMVQSENYLTGASCFLLMEHGFVTDDSIFSGFDT